MNRLAWLKRGLHRGQKTHQLAAQSKKSMAARSRARPSRFMLASCDCFAMTAMLFVSCCAPAEARNECVAASVAASL